MGEPLRDPKTGQALPPREQPGYYAGFRTMKQKGYWDAATRDLVVERVEKKPKPLKFFTAEEETVMRAVAERVLPQEDRAPERRIDVLAGIDDRLSANRIEGYRFEDMPSDQEAYRIACRAFAEMAWTTFDKPFAELSVLAQETLLQEVHDGKPNSAKSTWAEMNVARFWPMLVSDCCAVYYAHPWSWDEVGFGGPAYPRGYMRLEEGQAEPWEVNEQRYEWAAPTDTISDKPQTPPEAQKQAGHAGQGGTH